jgi:hypothetical protein
VTWRAHLLAWAPTAEVALAGAAFFRLALGFSLLRLLTLLAILYLLPPALFRIHQSLWPMREGASHLDSADYVPWWGSHQIQGIYEIMPVLESALRAIPGVYSAWLRLWGARIGRNVYWTARVEILDRSLLDVGDRVVFGHKAACYGHVIAPRRGRLLLYVRRVKIGAGAFVGAGSRLGPGAQVAADAVLPVCTDIGIGEAFPATDAP